MTATAQRFTRGRPSRLSAKTANARQTRTGLDGPTVTEAIERYVVPLRLYWQLLLKLTSQPQVWSVLQQGVW